MRMKVYATINALEKMALLDRWNQILKSYCDIYLDATDDEIEKYNNYDGVNFSPINQLLNDAAIKPQSATEIIKAIRLNPSKVLDNPFSVFFLDIPSDKAKTIQRTYGVIFKNEDDIDDTELSKWREINSVEHETNHNWTEFLKGIKESPINSIIISDRYIFKNDDKKDILGKRNTSGMDNIINILDAILPNQFTKKYPFHVFVLFSWSTGSNENDKCKIPFKDLSQELNLRIIQEIDRPYTIKFELLSVIPDSFNYELTHNRRVITNYHVIRVEHKLSAFKNNISDCTQTLNWDSLFSKGINDNNDPPFTNLKVLLNGLKHINEYGLSNKETCMYEYSCDGVCSMSQLKKDKIVFSEIKNRLIALS